MLRHRPLTERDAANCAAIERASAASAVLKHDHGDAEKHHVPTYVHLGATGTRGDAGSPLRALLFALVAVACISPLVVTDLHSPRALVLAAAVTAIIGLSAVLIPWRRLPPAARDVLPFGFFVVLILLREAGGGSGSGIGPLTLLPVCWLALHGGRTALRLSLLATGAVFIGPWLLVGGVAYPGTDLRRGIATMLVAGLIGISVQTLVATLQAQKAASIRAAHETANLAEQLAAVARVRHSMQVNQDPREVLCQGARDLTGAAVGFLLEPRDEHSLERTAGVGFEATAVTVPMDPARSAAADCLLSGQRIFIADASTDPRIPDDLRSQVDAVSLLYEPVVRRGQIVAVLVVGWRQATVPDDSALAAVNLMAVEAAVALEQADLLVTVQQLARTDQLTDIPNRRAFDELLPSVLAIATEKSPMCVALLDLDHFKVYNDTFGHPAGDDFLQVATRSWARQLRGTDIIARLGGEEFAVVLPDCDVGDAASVLDKLRSNTPADQTVSIGIAQWDGQESQRALMQRVDAALYQAKADGRNRLHCAA
jgi:diguanylate cyclase (GGDEF)-like protein